MANKRSGGNRLVGRVKWFSNEKGYGFIGVDGEKDVFLHISALRASNIRTVDKDQAVEFEIEDGQKGPCAANLRLAEK